MSWKGRQCKVQIDARERDTHISNKICAPEVIFIENNTVVVVAREPRLRTSKVHVFLEEQSTIDVYASTLAERKTRGKSCCC